MKKCISGIAMVLFAISSSFANPVSKNNSITGKEAVEHAFKKEFSQAEKISWSVTEGVYKAQFELNGQVMFAFLNENGELLGAYRNILSTQLPLQLSVDIRKNYAGYWITELFEFVKDGETSYYVNLENDSRKIVLRSGTGTNWNVLGVNGK